MPSTSEISLKGARGAGGPRCAADADTATGARESRTPTDAGAGTGQAARFAIDVAPGDAFAVVNLGCKVNRVESDTIAAALIAQGGRPSALVDADIVVVNTCTVTGEADRKARKAVRHVLAVAKGAVVYVTGCGVEIDPGTYASLDARVNVVSRSRMLASLEREPSDIDLRMGPGFRTRVSLKAQDGCNRACTYCIVHVARGPARSTPVDTLVGEAARYLDEGVGELVLTGIDLGSYDSGGVRLEGLVRRLLECADEHCPENASPARIRVSSVEPHTLSPAFVELLANAQGRLCRHLHVPLQSGSAKVLSEMARPYTAEGFAQIVEGLYARVPTLSLTTDVICGFPGETDEDFERTLELARRCRFSKIHVFPYSRREGTPAAARPDQVPAQVKAERAARLRALSDELRAADLARRAGTRELALVEGDSALTESYHEVPSPVGAPLGSLVEVRL